MRSEGGNDVQLCTMVEWEVNVFPTVRANEIFDDRPSKWKFSFRQSELPSIV